MFGDDAGDLFMTLVNQGGTPDRLIAVRSDLAGTQIGLIRVDPGRQISQASAITVPAQSEVTLGQER
jgi:copper(I)-binding protein